MQKGLDLRKGPLVKGGWFEMGEGRRKRLLMGIHHLVVDGVSWRILLGDLQRGYENLKGGKKVELGRKSSSYQQWARELKAYGQREEMAGELEYWEGLGWEKWEGIPVDGKGGENLAENAQSVGLWLEEGETEALLKEVPEK